MRSRSPSGNSLAARPSTVSSLSSPIAVKRHLVEIDFGHGLISAGADFR
jgi:hypothetical protein